MKKIAFLFPGQGSQKIGMGKNLNKNSKECYEVFNEVDEALKRNLSTLMFDGSEEELKITSNTQPAIMAVSVAIFRLLIKLSKKSDISELCDVCAGHSLGEYSALTASGAIKLSDTAKLLENRGKFMIQATSSISSKGAMYALLGCDIESAKSICKILSSDGICEIANDNGGGQIVLSGEEKAFLNIQTLLKRFAVKKAIKVPVNIPFHSSIIKSASEAMEKELSYYNFHSPKQKIISNYTADLYNKDIKNLLVQQIHNPVRWRESIEKMYNDFEIRTFVEIGPGNVLSNLAKRQHKDAKVYSLQEIIDVENFLKEEF